MSLSDRKKKILRSLVDDYIASATPVSSKDIQEKCLIDCSSATIRNELSALESMGYLLQPHTSAGRVPSTKAFRFYVDQLMEATPLDAQEISIIEQHFSKKLGTIQEIMGSVAKVLAEVTHYPSVAMGKLSGKEVLKNIQLLRIADDKALVLIVTNANVLKDACIDVNRDASNESLEQASKWLNTMFVDKTLNELKTLKSGSIALSDEIAQFKNLFDEVLRLLVRVSEEKREVYAEGGVQMLEYPEYSDIERAKQFLAVIENKENLVNLFDDSIEFSIKIGKEEHDELPDGCALVTAKFDLNDVKVGNAAVIGPVRMDYKKVVSVMGHINKLVKKILVEQEDSDNDGVKR